MDVIQTAQQRANTPPLSSAEPETGSMINSDFQTFLTMLTTQMENQDPLNPMESTDFATQLATFSGVEQQVRTNELLGDLQTGMTMMGMGQLSGWVGMDARAEMPVAFTGSPITLAAPPHNLADRMELVVRNEAGSEVQRLNLTISDDPFTWAGVGPDGGPLPEGIYSFTTEAFADDTLLEERPAQAYARVEEAMIRDGQTWLNMSGGISIPADLVQGIRNP